MAETTYEVEWVALEPIEHPDKKIPMIARVIWLDGDEVARGYPDHKEVTAAYPQVIEAYFDQLKIFFSQLSTWMDEQTEFTRAQQIQFAFIGMMVNDYHRKFDNDIDWTGTLLY
jgi:hypothetical protein